MKLSLSEISTVGASFEEDVRAYAAAGFDGHRDLGDEAACRRRRERRSASERAVSGSRAAFRRFPQFFSSGSREWKARPIPRYASQRFARAMRRLAAYQPESRPVPHRADRRSRARRGAARSSSRDFARSRPAAREAGVRFGLEPAHPSQHETASFVNTIADGLALLEEAGLDDVGIMMDTYNLWHERPEAVAAVADRVTGLHVADEPPDLERTDRVLPGEGGTRSAEQVRALVDAGWDGYLDVEIFSTPDRFWGIARGRGGTTSARGSFAPSWAVYDSTTMRPELPTGTVTFLFTDVEGSTRLLHTLGAGALCGGARGAPARLRAAFAAHGGVEVDTQGDAFFVAFPTAEEQPQPRRRRTSALASGPISRAYGTAHGRADSDERGIRRDRRAPRRSGGRARPRRPDRPLPRNRRPPRAAIRSATSVCTG